MGVKTIGDIILKFKTRSRSLVALYCYTRGLIDLPYSPLEVFIEPTNNCNLKCIICPHSTGIERGKGFMSLDIFKKILKEIVKIRVLKTTLNFAGEPLLNSNIFEMIRLVKTHHLYTRIHTNATVLSDDYIKKLILSGLDELSFSFDDSRKEIYETIRVNASYEKTLANIKKFLEIKKEIKAKKPFTIIQQIKLNGFEYDACESDAYQKLFSGFPVDKFHVIYSHNWSGTCTGQFIKKYDSRLTKIPCNAIWFRLAIGWDGKVYACCNEMHGKLLIGDLNTTSSLLDIWNGPMMQRLRSIMLNSRYDEIEACKNCDVLLRSENSKMNKFETTFAKTVLSLQKN